MMKRKLATILFASITTISAVQAEDLVGDYKPPKSSSVPESSGAGTGTGKSEGLLSYKPPQGNVPQSFGAGTRGATIHSVDLLAPKHTALTTQAQPVLYWYLSKQETQTFHFVLTKEDNQELVFEKNLPAIEKIGLQQISLADFGVELNANEEYRWTLEVDDNIEGSATLKYTPPATTLKTVEALAQEGYWYDALQQLVEKHSPQANELLKQININKPIF